MSNPSRPPILRLPLVVLALSLAFCSPGLFAADVASPSPASQQPQQPQALGSFLHTLAAGSQATTEHQIFTPAPENKILSCSYQACPTGQTCWYCHQNWFCIFNYPDPDMVPPGCSSGPGGPQ
jgi:hypothetical protein